MKERDWLLAAAIGLILVLLIAQFSVSLGIEHEAHRIAGFLSELTGGREPR